MAVTRFDPFAPAVMADPYPHYARLRREGPVSFNEQTQTWTVSRYAEVMAVLRDHAAFTSAQGIGPRRSRGGMVLIQQDPPAHTRMRALVSRAFTPRMVAQLEPRIRQIAEELVDAALARGDFDLVQDLGTPLPVIVIAEMLGVEAGRRDDFKRWSDSVTHTFGGSIDELMRGRMQQSSMEMGAYFWGQIEQRRRNRGPDLMSALVAAQEEQDALTTPEILAFCVLLLIAGNVTTTNLIGNAGLALLDHPDAEESIRRDPALIPSLVEEALRYDSPVQGLWRTTTRAVRLAGTAIPADARVYVPFASANRDEAQFPDPDRFDVTRSPNNHVAFGYGVHYCLGAPLARLEARVAFETLFLRTKHLHPDPARPPVRFHNAILRGLERLPLACEPA